MSDTTSPAPSGGLLRSKKLIAAARRHDAVPADGGGTGRSDGND
ncbi:hypothetical protein ACWCZ5_32985 [Streptomyces sp. NPDC001667]